MPMMSFSGLKSMMMFASMISFMGMAINIADSAQTEGQVDRSGIADATWGECGDSADTSESGVTGTGSYNEMDYGSASGSGMDLSGFDYF